MARRIGPHTVKLLVRSAAAEDVFKDVARINEDDRGGHRAGQVYRLVAPTGKALVVIRGMRPLDKGKIRIDEEVRKRLGVTFGKEVELRIEPVGLRGELEWAWRATDPAYRVASKLGVLGLILGVIGAALGVWSVWLTFHPPH
jgi:hypothetical protein